MKSYDPVVRNLFWSATTTAAQATINKWGNTPSSERAKPRTFSYPRVPPFSNRNDCFSLLARLLLSTTLSVVLRDFVSKPDFIYTWNISVASSGKEKTIGAHNTIHIPEL